MSNADMVSVYEAAWKGRAKRMAKLRRRGASPEELLACQRSMVTLARLSARAMNAAYRERLDRAQRELSERRRG